MQDLFRFKCWVRQLAAPTKLADEARRAGGGALTAEMQRRLSEEVFADAALRAAPPGPSYRRRLLQALVRAAEEDNCELADELVDLFIDAQLDGQADPDTDGWRYKTFTYDAASADRGPAPPLQQLPGTVALRCCQNLLADSTGAHEWSAGLRLAELCLSRPELFAGKACLELGCGTGMVGVALARAGARSVVLTDGNAAVVDNCCANLALNGMDARPGASAVADPPDGIQVEQRVWEEWTNDVAPPDVLLGADLLYDPKIFPVLVPLAKRLLTRPPKPGTPQPVAYFAAQVRNEASMRGFEAEVASQGCLRLEVLDFEPVVSFQHLLREEGLQNVRVYRIQHDPDALPL
jgi:hypothetical protein